MGVQGIQMPSPEDVAMMAAAQRIGGGNPAGPSKDEQRRVAALNFAIAAKGGASYSSAEQLIKDATTIAKFIDRG